MWNAHHSGGLATQTSKAIADNLGGVGQPLFYLNSDNEDLDVFSGNVDAKVKEVLDNAELLSSLKAPVGMGSEAILDKDNNLKVDTKIKFYENSDAGEFYIATYIVKKNLVASQASVGPNAVHHAVIDKSFTTGQFGTFVGKAPIQKNAEFSTSASLTDLKLHNGKLEDTKVFVILWNKTTSGKHIFINGREVNIEKSNLSSNDDVEFNTPDLDFNAVIEKDYVIIQANKSLKKSTVSLVDIMGKEISFTTEYVNDSTLKLNNIQAVSGNYFIKVSSGDKVKSKQIVLVR
jgi:hypothetical protein